MTVINPGTSGGLTQGTAAAKPATPSPGQLYYATDTGELWLGNAAGTSWNGLNHTSGAWSALGQLSTTAGNVDVSGVGDGLRVAEGSNAKQGTYGPLVAGTLAVANTSVTASSRIIVCRSAGGTNPGAHYVSAQTAGTGFTVTSTNASDTGSGVFFILEPG